MALHMNGGNGESSYANNSILQKMVILKARPVLEDTIKDMCNGTFPECFKIADLGCSSGPNTLLVISNIMDIVHEFCQKNNRKAPEFHVSLNDLPENDFNTIFKSLPAFYVKLKKEKGEKLGPCFISGVPGSFYGQLFPKNSLHFVHSSYSLHWLSQVPGGLENNKGNIYMAKSSPPDVFEAYLKQFEKDFSMFLRARSDEIISNGKMILTFIGRSIADPTSKDCSCLWELLVKSLLDIVAEGLVGEADIDSFNLPLYTPHEDEVKAIIRNEGSFTLETLEAFQVNWDARDNDDDKDFVLKYNSGKVVAKTIRAVTESMLTTHFGNSVTENLFGKYAKHVVEHLTREKTKFFNIVISLTKK